MIYSEINYLLLFMMVIISIITGRISIRRSKYTGWYEKFIDVSKLVFLIQNSFLFFISTLFCMLLIFASPNTLQHDIPVLKVMLVLYMLEVIVFFCSGIILSFLRMCTSKIKCVIKFLYKHIFRRRNTEVIACHNSPQNKTPSEPTSPRNLLLRFISWFNTALSICIIIFIAFLLISELLASKGADGPSILSILLKQSHDNGHVIIMTYHYDLLLPSFLLSLTASTGALLSSNINYKQSLIKSDNQHNQQRAIEDLSLRIRNR